MNNKTKSQIGLVLTELVIALTLVTILIGATVSLYDTNRSRAEALYQKMSEVAGGLLRMKTDSACFPNKLAGMVNPLDGSDTFCGVQSSENWKGPYTDVGTRFGTDSTNSKDIVLEQITPALSVFLEERVLMANTNGAGHPINEKKAWVLSTRGLTPELQTHFLDYCSELPVGAGAGSIEKSRCFKQADGQVGFLVDANEGWEQYYDVLINPVVIAEACKGASCAPPRNPNPTTTTIPPIACTVGVNCPNPPPIIPDPPGTKYCPDGTVMPASGICSPTITYCPDGMTVMPANGVCPTIKPPCRVGIDPACTVTTSSGGFSSSSSSSGGMPGYRGSDGQLYSSPDAVPGQDDPCGDCNRELTTTYEKDLADAVGTEMSAASSIGGSIASALGSAISSVGSAIGGALSSIGSAVGSFFSSIGSFFSSAFGGDSSGGGDYGCSSCDGDTGIGGGGYGSGGYGESGGNMSSSSSSSSSGDGGGE